MRQFSLGLFIRGQQTWRTDLPSMDDAGRRLRHVDLRRGSRSKALLLVRHLLQSGLVDVVLRDPGARILEKGGENDL